MLLQSLLGVATLATMALADEYHHFSTGEYVALSCKYAVSGTAKYCPKDKVDAYTFTCACNNVEVLGSLAFCGHQESLNRTHVWNEFMDYYISKCPKLTHEKIEAAYKNVTNYIVNPNSVAKFNKTQVINYPVEFNPKLYHNAYNSLSVQYGNLDDGMFMGASAAAYWIIILALATMYNFGTKLGFIQGKLDNGVIRKLRKHISMPALGGQRHAERVNNWVINGFIPSRIETIILSIFFVLIAVYEGVRYKTTVGNITWIQFSNQKSRYVGDRSALNMSYVMIITIMFSGRNNIFIWLTGWKRSTFVTFHRWVARIFVLLVILHGISMGVQSKLSGKIVTRIHAPWFHSGIVAAIATIIIGISSAGFIRAHAYELFMWIHVLIGYAFFVAAWKHMKFNSYGEWMYATFAFFALDKVLRIVRVIHFGGIKIATIQAVSDETLKITVPKHKNWKAFPGAHAYLYIMTPSLFWQSHPFSIVESADGNYIHFYSKIKRGITRTLYEKYADHQVHQIKVLVEGPYGDHKPLKRYDNALLYAGGNGIPSLFAYARELNVSTTCTQMYWVIRHWHSMDWFFDELVELHDTCKNVKLTLYVSKGEDYKIGKVLNQKISSSSSLDKEFSTELTKELTNDSTPLKETLDKWFPNFEFIVGRPDMNELVPNDLKSLPGNTAVMSCGHSTMIDDIRRNVTDCLDDEKLGRIDLFEESQWW